VPQCPQKRVSSGFSKWQLGHLMVTRLSPPNGELIITTITWQSQTILDSSVKCVVKRISRRGRNSLMTKNLAKELTHHNKHQKFFSFQGDKIKGIKIVSYGSKLWSHRGSQKAGETARRFYLTYLSLLNDIDFKNKIKFKA
jgi:hypothetical protein